MIGRKGKERGSSGINAALPKETLINSVLGSSKLSGFPFGIGGAGIQLFPFEIKILIAPAHWSIILAEFDLRFQQWRQNLYSEVIVKPVIHCRKFTR